MTMPLFLIVVTESDEGCRMERRLEKHYAKRYHKISDTAYLVEDNSLAKDVAAAVGIKGENRDTSGVVLGLNGFYSGFASKSLWEWLAQHEQ